MRLPLYVAKFRFRLRMYVHGMRVLSMCAFMDIACACIFVLRVVVYACAFVCCNLAFHFTSVCRLHVCFAFVFGVLYYFHSG